MAKQIAPVAAKRTTGFLNARLFCEDTRELAQLATAKRVNVAELYCEMIRPIVRKELKRELEKQIPELS